MTKTWAPNAQKGGFWASPIKWLLGIHAGVFLCDGHRPEYAPQSGKVIIAIDPTVSYSKQ
ncbi:hypothetical protein [Vreelandella rituensis]|uniref:hypothetical protein n=1 Tax=Vreelandella rituensis TaxID=2282306 RepID=UPI0011C075B3|nr:hypothetical protein [Halomonas rituensis]